MGDINPIFGHYAIDSTRRAKSSSNTPSRSRSRYFGAVSHGKADCILRRDRATSILFSNTTSPGIREGPLGIELKNDF